MSFDTTKAIRNATGRAKSDVANKLVGMFLHEISRRACLAGGLHVATPSYGKTVSEAFGNRCVYCDRDLEHDRAAVEHLDGMNRFRAGLHVPGNVATACRRCNNEKRRDDQNPHLILASSGWSSFLRHNGDHCEMNCKSCSYWSEIWPDQDFRRQSLQRSTQRIEEFRNSFSQFIEWTDLTRQAVKMRAEALYRRCQQFATDEISSLISEMDLDFQVLQKKP